LEILAVYGEDVTELSEQSNSTLRLRFNFPFRFDKEDIFESSILRETPSYVKSFREPLSL